MRVTVDSGVEARKIIIRCVISAVKNTWKTGGCSFILREIGRLPRETGSEHGPMKADPGKRVSHVTFSPLL